MRRDDPSPIRKLLIANRGEIAVRIIRACRELGITPIAAYSDADRGAMHVRLADEAYRLGPAPSRESYLSIPALLSAAHRAGADAIHPGYGFLSENADFARACAGAGLIFVGPTPETLETMGEKTAARRTAIAAGVPVVPGSTEPLLEDADLLAEAKRVGYPVLLKPAGGGGGKGMRRVEGEAELLEAAARGRSEALAAFGDGRLYLEKALDGARHVEVQVLADGQGGVVHLFDRECSLQRRHQKIVEESPCPSLPAPLRARLGDWAVALARHVGYRSAGTLEFLVSSAEEAYFLEMNTRIQVEHPVTEAVTGWDLVKLQLEIASGARLPFTQDDLSVRGHAIECRICAEDPAAGFLPSPGWIEHYRSPGGPGVREDAGFGTGDEVTVHYDPLLAKVIAWGRDRTEARARLRRALDELVILGVTTNVAFLRRLLDHPRFVAAEVDIGFVERIVPEIAGEVDTTLDARAVAVAVRYVETRNRRGGGVAAAAESPWRIAARRDQLERRG